MNVILIITSSYNSGQPAVITCDQPVYALAKYIQWKFPTLYGEDEIVMMMGGLHIEMAIQNMLGKWLTGSGWTDIFLKANVATAGRCEAFLKSSHVKRTRYAHEVCLASLFILINDVYHSDTSKDCTESFELWVSRRCGESANFLYWYTTMNLECLLLTFVRSMRESNFLLFVQTLKDICPWLFSLDMTHYARWLPIFVKTLEELPIRHPKVYDDFLKGHFTSKKSNSAFSAISDDHLHEQINKVVKGDGGAVGIFDNGTALLKWMVGGPEIARMVQEFETSSGISTSDSSKHHESTNNFQARFKKHVSAVVSSLRQDGNPFSEQELQTTDNKKILMSASAEKSVFQAKSKGLDKCKKKSQTV
jgi:hypothetical protein